MDNHGKKAYSTKSRTAGVLNKWIIPRWGEYRPGDIKPVAVEEWLDGLTHNYRKKDNGKPLANGTKVKIRNIMSAIFRYGMRYDFFPVSRGKSDEVCPAERQAATHPACP